MVDADLAMARLRLATEQSEALQHGLHQRQDDLLWLEQCAKTMSSGRSTGRVVVDQAEDIRRSIIIHMTEQLEDIRTALTLAGTAIADSTIDGSRPPEQALRTVVVVVSVVPWPTRRARDRNARRRRARKRRGRRGCESAPSARPRGAALVPIRNQPMNRRAGQEVASSVADWPARCQTLPKDETMMKTNSNSPLTPNEGPEPVALGGDALPCGDCGCAVATPDPDSVDVAERVRNGRATVVPVTKCPACAGRDWTAVALAQRYLRTGVTRDGRRYTGKDAIQLLVEARAATDATGMEPLPVDSSARPAAVLALEIEHLGHALHGLRWRERLSPPASLVADPIRLVEPGTANPHPWAHLDEEESARLRRGVIKVLGERVALQALDVAVVPPAELEETADRRGIPVTAGCLYCGVGLELSGFLNR